MKNVAIFYASKGGVAKDFAEKIASKINADVINIKDVEVKALEDYKNVILMSSSYFFGALCEDWGSKVKLLHTVDFTNKNVALVAVGSCERHADSFCSGVADFYDKLANSGARFIGFVNAKDYNYTFSRLQFGNYLRALCLDKADADKNDERINKWVENIKPFLA